METAPAGRERAAPARRFERDSRRAAIQPGRHPADTTPVSAEDTTAITHRRTAPSDEGESCLVIIYGPDLGRRIPLDPGDTVIGRGSDTDLLLDSPSVSRRHCRLHCPDAGAPSVSDLGSTNGTLLNDRELLPGDEPSLRSGDLVQVGSVIFKYLSGGHVEALYHEEIYRTMIIDGLTQVANRRYLMDFLDRETARCQRHGGPLALVMIDVDNFKDVNDSFGHLAGDQVLRRLAGVIRDRTRREECVARYGGEEFAIVLPETELDGAVAFAERIRGAIEHEPFEASGEGIEATVSAGVAVWTEGMTACEDLIETADSRLYRAKAEGRNRVCS